MSIAIGSKDTGMTEALRTRRSEGGKLGELRAFRFRNGRYGTSAEVKAALRERLEDRFAKLEQLAESNDPRIALDATKYLIDRVLGKPTEKIAGDQDEAPVSFVAPTDAQMGVLARKVTGGDEDEAVKEAEGSTDVN